MAQELASEAAAAQARQRRLASARNERELTATLHKSELLWLLARGLMFDAAADDPLLQVPPSGARLQAASSTLEAAAQLPGTPRRADPTPWRLSDPDPAVCF